MPEYALEIETLNDTTFGMGAGVSGVVDAEIQQDELGLPTLSGRAIKGLLVNSCSEILYPLPAEKKERWQEIARQVFGERGDTSDEEGLFICDAVMAPDLRAYLQYLSAQNQLSRQDLLSALTDVRRQTAMSEFGAPKDETLRATRVLLRKQTLYATFILPKRFKDEQKALLGACALSLRRAGTGRGRGKGKLKIRITQRPLEPHAFAQAADKDYSDLAPIWFKVFKEMVLS
jgi:hypothetical protein